jgi:hypothetical protein
MARNRVCRQEMCGKNRASGPLGAITARQHGGTYNSLRDESKGRKRERRNSKKPFLFCFSLRPWNGRGKLVALATITLHLEWNHIQQL